MVHEPEDTSIIQNTFTTKASEQRYLLNVVDACFEMFSARELRNPGLILPELLSAFPEFTEQDLLKAVALALSWKRLLRAAGRPIH